MNKITKLACLTLGIGTVGCDTPKDKPPIDQETQSLGLKQFQDCSELRSYVGDVIVKTMLNYEYGYWGWDEMATPDVSEDSGSNDSSGPSDYTTTNVQEEGVDEVDMVKTDGQFIYVAQDRGVHIVDSWPVETAEKVATVELEGWARGLFLQEDKLVVFEQIYDSEVSSYGNSTRITIIDISDRTAPQILRTIDLDGYMADGRMIEGNVYLVLNHWMYLPDSAWNLLYNSNLDLPEMDWSLEGEELDQKLLQVRYEAAQILRPHVDDMVANMDLDEILPKMLVQTPDSTGQVERMHACDDIYRPPQVSQYNILSLVHLDTQTNELNNKGLMSDGWTIYASSENLYVAQSSRWWWWGAGDMDMTSQIHKFDLQGEDGPEYASSGSVDGWIYDQFALSEYDGHLRVATTDFNNWWTSSEDDEEPANNIFVLRDDNKGQLRTVGSLTGLAPGERIYATRMMGSKGYVVTFEQIDPLFTIDLSNPEAPEVKGELKIPGYSAYLHPMGPDHLLAVGVDGDDQGNLGGVAISVFDVSDFANPTLAHKHVISDEDNWSWSEALYDHHAFTFHRGVLSIPAYSWDYSQDGYSYFSGILSFAVDGSEGIEEIGRVNHLDLVQDSECLYSRWYGYEEEVCGDWGWYASVRRSVYIEDNLFSISNYGIKVNDLNNPSDEITRTLFYPKQ